MLRADSWRIARWAIRRSALESGGRMIDAILTNTVLPKISEEFLTRMMEGKPIERAHVTLRDGEFDYRKN